MGARFASQTFHQENVSPALRQQLAKWQRVIDLAEHEIAKKVRRCTHPFRGRARARSAIDGDARVRSVPWSLSPLSGQLSGRGWRWLGLQTDENTWLKARLKTAEWEVLSKTREVAMVAEQSQSLRFALEQREADLHRALQVPPARARALRAPTAPPLRES